jgi:hypothetical protein
MRGGRRLRGQIACLARRRNGQLSLSEEGKNQGLDGRMKLERGPTSTGRGDCGAKENRLYVDRVIESLRRHGKDWLDQPRRRHPSQFPLNAKTAVKDETQKVH